MDSDGIFFAPPNQKTVIKTTETIAAFIRMQRPTAHRLSPLSPPQKITLMIIPSLLSVLFPLRSRIIEMRSWGGSRNTSQITSTVVVTRQTGASDAEDVILRTDFRRG